MFFAPVPALRPLRTDTVYTRARRFGGYANVDDEYLSWWDYRGAGRAGAVCGADETGMACVMRDGGGPAPASAKCVLVDDQFAYIPRVFAETFFRQDAQPPASFHGGNQNAAAKGGKHYPVVAGHDRCQWPEGQVTCRLLDAGARLEPLRISFRIVAHTRLNKGDHPPQTRPRSALEGGPHVCPGGERTLPADVNDWSWDDIVVWTRQDVGLGGVGAALAGATPGKEGAGGTAGGGVGLALLLSKPNLLLYSEAERAQLVGALRARGQIVKQKLPGG